MFERGYYGTTSHVHAKAQWGSYHTSPLGFRVLGIESGRQDTASIGKGGETTSHSSSWVGVRRSLF